MSNTYFLSHAAEQDIEEIINYIAQESIQVAYDFIDTLYDTFDKLVENPYMGHVREDLTDHPVRFWTFKWHYLIIYSPEQPLEIARVLSGFRDIPNLI
ncbi:MAG: type II toxin-antitoxin system RelE/ParE family toxin [Gammaproteobacteria bacterium]|nr:type II toxin-antitoxin system RelE/ParE family toxin [Gammaproteobacteria bacterium]